MKKIVIVGAGISGLALALALHLKGIHAKVFEAARKIEPLGVGINIQSYAAEILQELGILDRIAHQAILTQEMAFFNRQGQKIHALPLGRYGGHKYPQISVHRGVLQQALLEVAKERLGDQFLFTGHPFISAVQEGRTLRANFLTAAGEKEFCQVECDALIGADGIHSRVYRSAFPEGPPLREVGVQMWRGMTVAPPFLTGATMARVGVPSHGKLVIYPVKNNVNAQGDQLINWVAEIDAEIYKNAGVPALQHKEYLVDFFGSRKFDWINIPELIDRSVAPIISMPMMDRDPVERWQSGCITLIGDAAHPMAPVGSNGAGQALLDAYSLSAKLAEGSVEEAFRAYENERRPLTSNIVMTDRQGIPDQLIDIVDRRTGGRAFTKIEEVLSPEEAVRLAMPDYQARPWGLKSHGAGILAHA